MWLLCLRRKSFTTSLAAPLGLRAGKPSEVCVLDLCQEDGNVRSWLPCMPGLSANKTEVTPPSFQGLSADHFHRKRQTQCPTFLILFSAEKEQYKEECSSHYTEVYNDEGTKGHNY